MATTNVQTPRNRGDTSTPQQSAADEAARLRAAIRELAPAFAARSKEIEDGRRVPGDIALKLRRLGLFRSLLPRSVGGLELSAADVVPMIETLAVADSSLRWMTMISMTAQMFAIRDLIVAPLKKAEWVIPILLQNCHP